MASYRKLQFHTNNFMFLCQILSAHSEDLSVSTLRHSANLCANGHNLNKKYDIHRLLLAMT